MGFFGSSSSSSSSEDEGKVFHLIKSVSSYSKTTRQFIKCKIDHDYDKLKEKLEAEKKKKTALREALQGAHEDIQAKSAEVDDLTGQLDDATDAIAELQVRVIQTTRVLLSAVVVLVLLKFARADASEF